MTRESVLTCPSCSRASVETMPTKHCGARLKPKAGDCYVFCGYGSVRCPPMQSSNACCK